MAGGPDRGREWSDQKRLYPLRKLVHTPDRATRRERNSVMMPRPTLTDGFFAGANEAGSGRG